MILITKTHVLFEPHVMVESNRKKLAIDRIKFLKKQKMTLIGSDVCLEVAVAADSDSNDSTTADGIDIVLFRGFSYQDDRDRCYEMICQSSLDTFGRSLASAEEGAWAELRVMFGLPANETMLASWTCSCVTKTDTKPNGHLYLTENYLCFHSYFFGARHQDVFKLVDISKVEKSSYPAFVPNAIQIFTRNPGRRLTFFGFGSLAQDRNRAYVEIGQAARFGRARAEAEPQPEVGTAGCPSMSPPEEMVARAEDTNFLVTVVCGNSTCGGPVALMCTLDGEGGSSGARTTLLRSGGGGVHEFVVECSAIGELRSLRLSAKEGGEGKGWLRAIANVGIDVASAATPAVCVHLVVVNTISGGSGNAARGSGSTAGGTIGDKRMVTCTAFQFDGRPVFVGGAAVKRTRLSAAETFDAVAGDQRLRLEAVDELYENQRRPALTLGGAVFSAEALLRTDRGPWTDETGSKAIFKANFDNSLPRAWRWSSDWTIAVDSGGTDPDGWQYAFNWKGSGGSYCAAVDVGCLVRRRRWVRSRSRRVAVTQLHCALVCAASLPANGYSDHAFSRVVSTPQSSQQRMAHHWCTHRCSLCVSVKAAVVCGRRWRSCTSGCSRRRQWLATRSLRTPPSGVGPGQRQLSKSTIRLGRRGAGLSPPEQRMAGPARPCTCKSTSSDGLLSRLPDRAPRAVAMERRR